MLKCRKMFQDSEYFAEKSWQSLTKKQGWRGKTKSEYLRGNGILISKAANRLKGGNMSQVNVQTFMFKDDGRIPNNPLLPFLVYPGALAQADAAECQALFERNGWVGSWVNGVYNYHHYHSVSHEVLGVVSGSARIQFGGEQGQIIEVRAGDVGVLPAGTGHCNKGASADFQVVGAYPRGQERWDLCTGKPNERPTVLENIQKTPLPQADPLYGVLGPLMDAWNVRL